MGWRRPVNPECPKCGKRMSGPSYHRNWTECSVREQSKQGEHLHYRCVCGFDTTRPTEDAPRE